MLTAEQWRAREHRRGGARDDDNRVVSNSRGNRRGHYYNCNERGHFKRDCPQRRKEPTAEQALLADFDIENVGLL
ncbi:hypothetical protein D1007_37231 [Hordeum vulgare]|nr:hypothetical protein D1007_37231 [Hordeum vulgare]